jgi:hypothetical protein
MAVPESPDAAAAARPPVRYEVTFKGAVTAALTVTVTDEFAAASKLSYARPNNETAFLLVSNPAGRLATAELDVLLALMEDSAVEIAYTKSYVSG